MDIMRQRCEEIESGGVLVLSSKAYPDGKYLYDYQETAGQRRLSQLTFLRRFPQKPREFSTCVLVEFA
jgi:hypothetical protein